jgi:hypothetical protein
MMVHDDAGVVRVLRHPLHDAAVDLERVQRQPAEVGERRKAGAEVIEGDAQAEIAQRGELAGAHRGPRCGARSLLGDLPAFGKVGFVTRHVAALGIDDGAVGAACEAKRNSYEGEAGYPFHLMLPCKTTRA